MRLGGHESSLELAIVGYESAPSPEPGRTYDLETDWLVLRAVVRRQGEVHRIVDGISLDVEDCVRLIDWLTVVATSNASEWSDVASSITFAEPDLAAALIERTNLSATIRWILFDERSAIITRIGGLTYNASVFDVAALRTDVIDGAAALTDSLRNLVRRRSEILLADGVTVEATPLLA